MYSSRPGCRHADRPVTQVPLTWPVVSSNAVWLSLRFLIRQPKTEFLHATSGLREPVTNPCGSVFVGLTRLGQEQAPAVKVGPSEGNQSEGAMGSRESEGCVTAMTPGNVRHTDPVEQRRPVLV